MLNVYADKTFDIPVYTISNVDGIDKRVLDSTTTHPCRITELSTKDISLLNGVEKDINNTWKLYTNDTVIIKNGNVIISGGKEYRVMRPYSPVGIDGIVAYTKLYIVEIQEG